MTGVDDSKSGFRPFFLGEFVIKPLFSFTGKLNCRTSPASCRSSGSRRKHRCLERQLNGRVQLFWTILCSFPSNLSSIKTVLLKESDRMSLFRKHRTFSSQGPAEVSCVISHLCALFHHCCGHASTVFHRH